jgi:hypothetical protein
MTDELTPREQALRAIPLSYSLALRLRDAGVAPDVVSEYIDVDEPFLESLYRVAEAKFVSAHERILQRRCLDDS